MAEQRVEEITMDVSIPLSKAIIKKSGFRNEWSSKILIKSILIS